MSGNGPKHAVGFAKYAGSGGWESLHKKSTIFDSSEEEGTATAQPTPNPVITISDSDDEPEEKNFYSCSLDSRLMDLQEFVRKHLRIGAALNERHMKYTKQELMTLCEETLKVLKKEQTLSKINPPCVVVGDLHGQYFDLQRMFALFAQGEHHGCLTNKYVFLGDYVDRGRRSLECICFLLALKVSYPTKYVILRGNHECPHINRVYGFFDEIADRFDSADAEEVWNKFNEVFSWLPLAALIGGRILGMHGGISDKMKDVEDIAAIQRPLLDVPEVSLACDLLWSDPHPDRHGYSKNSVRGVSVFFGADAVHEFCARLKLKMIVRGHQVMPNGYSIFANRKLITIFTAARYDGKMNSGAVMTITEQGKVGFVMLSPKGAGPGAGAAPEVSPCERSSSNYYGDEKTGTEMRLEREQQKK